MIYYLKYDDLNIDEELSKIQNVESVVLKLEPNNKKCLFILGMLFANGVKIDLYNEGDFYLDENGKSFLKIAFVWSRLGEKSFTNDGYELGKRIIEARNGGTTVSKIINRPIENKIFLICPVRNATLEQKKWIEAFVEEKNKENYIVHAPHLHTNQVDPLGWYNICKQNADEIASSEEIDIYYDQSSTGSVFDLGVAYALNKPLVLLNRDEITFNEEDMIDTIIKNWPFNEKTAVKKLTNNQNNL